MEPAVARLVEQVRRNEGQTVRRLNREPQVRTAEPEGR
jgi:hypothetical protein